MTGSATSLSQHGASMPPAQWLVESIMRGVAALVQRDVVAGLREQQRLPRAGNACADDGNGGIPPRVRLASGTSLSLRRHDPDQVQRVTAVPDPSRSKLAVSQLLVGAPLGTEVNVGRCGGSVNACCRERRPVRAHSSQSRLSRCRVPALRAALHRGTMLTVAESCGSLPRSPRPVSRWRWRAPAPGRLPRASRWRLAAK